jgi:hypothetical protein
MLFISNYTGKNVPKDFPVQDSHPLTGNPDFAFPGGTKPEDYIPSDKSLVKDKGIVIEKLPGDSIGLHIGLKMEKDILGNPVTGLPDLGAIEVK